MNEFILYLLKASLGIMLFYFVYGATLRKETFFKANRLYLIVSLITSLILPFIGLRYNSYLPNTETGNIFVELNKNFNSISNTAAITDSEGPQFGWQNALQIIYLTGLIIFLVRIIWQCIDLLFLVSKSGLKKVNGLYIVENNRYGLPFSFFNIVFINPNFHQGTDLANILSHEKVHIRENHWFDLLIVELFTIVFWFNPFVWLFERSIKQNHEYLADEGVLAQGLSVGRYQAILINQIMGMQIIGLTNNLNYSLNKKRMKMMTKMKTPKIRAFKMIWALPAVALLLVAFAKPAYVMQPKTNPTTMAPQNYDERKIKVEAKVVDESGMPLEGASAVLYGKYEGAMTDNNGFFSLMMTKTDKIMISFIGYTTLVKSLSDIEQKDNKSGVLSTTFTLKKGIINLDIEKILRQGAPAQNAVTVASSKKNNTTKDEEVFIVVEALPEYPGGDYTLAQEITKNIQKSIQSNQTKGKVTIGFTIVADGSITNVQAIDKDNDKAAKEAISIISGLKNWNPGMQRGKAVPVNYSITINF